MDTRKNGSLGKWSKILWLACRAVISRAVISRRVADISKKKRLHRCTPPYSVLKSSLGPIFNFQVFFGGKTSPEQFWSYSNYLPWGVLIGGIFWWSLAEVSPSPSPNLTLRRKFENDRWLGFIRYGFALKWWVDDGNFNGISCSECTRSSQTSSMDDPPIKQMAKLVIFTGNSPSFPLLIVIFAGEYPLFRS